MISDEFYCPECGEIWDGEICDECGYTCEDYGKPSQKISDSESKYRRAEDKSKDRRYKSRLEARKEKKEE